ncbi:MAG: ATP-binding cassette domain-containing protein, partial [Alphaproteobacteria bacterium]|nr:ATP-binding cassette domain-containing protein [Alphaproteobacteria bacterium]
MPDAVAAEAPGIRLRDAAKIFGERDHEVVALAPTSLDVRKGELLVLLGPSGCGKTTLLRMIGGLTPPSDGRI